MENPLVDSTQLDEAFIGVVARISRRVAPMATVHRTYDVLFNGIATATAKVSYGP